MRGNSNESRGEDSNKALFLVGAKNFLLTFDGGRTAPYHITERRGKFFGSLWLGLAGLQWLLAEWASLRQVADSKGFFRFYRTGYSILEFSCLQNHHGRFVEVAEYHGGLNVVACEYRKAIGVRVRLDLNARYVPFSWVQRRRQRGRVASLVTAKMSRLGKCEIRAIVSQTAASVKSVVNLNKSGQVQLDTNAPRRPGKLTSFGTHHAKRSVSLMWRVESEVPSGWASGLRPKA